MRPNRSEKRAIIVGGAVTAILVIAFVIVPLMREWTRLGSILTPQRQHIEKVRDATREQSHLLGRRNELIGKLGSILGKEEAAKPGGKIPKGQPDTTLRKDAGAESIGSDKAEAGKPKTIDAPDAPSGISLAAYVERVAKKAGVVIARITASKPAMRKKRSRHFNPVGQRISCEAKIESLIKLLYALEKGERLVCVEHIELRCDSKKGQKIQVALHITGYESVVR